MAFHSDATSFIVGDTNGTMDVYVNGADRDGDGLCDEWETTGIDYDGGGVDLNLPAMGADPDHKDLFVEVDYMDCSGGGCPGGLAAHSHLPRGGIIEGGVGGPSPATTASTTTSTATPTPPTASAVS
jgi:hypothetical protein